MDPHLANIINHDLDNNSFSKGAKITTVRLICKKNDKDKIDNYRPSNESKRSNWSTPIINPLSNLF